MREIDAHTAHTSERNRTDAPPMPPHTHPPTTQTYTHQRWRLLKPLLRAHLDKAAADHSLENGGGPTPLVRTGTQALCLLACPQGRHHML